MSQFPKNRIIKGDNITLDGEIQLGEAVNSGTATLNFRTQIIADETWIGGGLTNAAINEFGDIIRSNISSWVDTATSNLNMDCFDIVNAGSIHVGNVYGKSPIDFHDTINILNTGAGGRVTFAAGIQIGDGTTIASDTGGIAIGNGATASAYTSGNSAVAIGASVYCGGSDGGICIGMNMLQYNSHKSISIGYNHTYTSYCHGSVLIGADINAGDGREDMVLIGRNTGGTSGSVAIGGLASASASDSIAIGYKSTAANDQSIAIGKYANVPYKPGDSHYNIAIGGGATVGTGAYAAYGDATAIGRASSASADDSIAIGHSSVASSADTIAIGQGASASNTDAIAIGHLAVASSAKTIQLGQATDGATGVLKFRTQTVADETWIGGGTTSASIDNTGGVIRGPVVEALSFVVPTGFIIGGDDMAQITPFGGATIGAASKFIMLFQYSEMIYGSYHRSRLTYSLLMINGAVTGAGRLDMRVDWGGGGRTMPAYVRQPLYASDGVSPSFNPPNIMGSNGLDVTSPIPTLLRGTFRKDTGSGGSFIAGQFILSSPSGANGLNGNWATPNPNEYVHFTTGIYEYDS